MSPGRSDAQSRVHALASIAETAARHSRLDRKGADTTWIRPRRLFPYSCSPVPVPAELLRSRCWEEGVKARQPRWHGSSARPAEMIAKGFSLACARRRANCVSGLAVARDLRQLGASVMLDTASISAKRETWVNSGDSVRVAIFLIDIHPGATCSPGLSRSLGVDCDSFRLVP